jgi:hypothetical protein
MAIDVTVDPVRQVAIFTGHGRMSVALVAGALEQLRHDPHYQPGMRRLWDGRDATVTLSRAEVRDLVVLLKQRARIAPSVRTALVVSSPLAYGLVRMFQAYAEFAQLPTTIWVFYDYDEALAWVARHSRPNVPPGDHPPGAAPTGQ